MLFATAQKPYGSARPIARPIKDVTISQEMLSDWQDLLDTLAGMTGAETTCIRRAHEQTTELLCIHTTGQTPFSVGDHFPRDPNHPPYCLPVIEAGRARTIEDARNAQAGQDARNARNGQNGQNAQAAQAGQRWKQGPDFAAGYRAYHGQPLRLADGSVFGALELFFTQPQEIPAMQKRYIQQVAAAINARLSCLTGCQLLRDEITERRAKEALLRRSERELRSINAAQEKMIAIITHDVYGPVASLSDRLEALVQDMPRTLPDRSGPPAQAVAGGAAPAQIGALAEEAATTKVLLEELLLWSRCQRRGIRCQCQVLELTFLVAECLGVVGPMAARKSIALESDIPGGIHLLADPNMIASALRHLITNAIKFSDPGGRILVQAARTGSQVTLRVRDNGRGIPDAVKAQLLRPGAGISTRGTRQERGSGFGLMLCKDLVELTGGQLRLESEEGLGTTVHLTLQGARAGSR